MAAVQIGQNSHHCELMPNFDIALHVTLLLGRDSGRELRNFYRDRERETDIFREGERDRVRER